MIEIIKDIHIESILSVVPRLKVSLNKKKASDQLLRVSRVIGVEHSFKAQDKTTTDLFINAAKEIIKKNKLKKKEINILICVTQTPDYLMPSCSNIVHQKLGLDKSCICFDINLGCSGYVYGLYVIQNLMSKSTKLKKGILLAGDTISKTIKNSDSSNKLLFGDAVAATYLKKKLGEKSNFLLGSATEGYDKLMIKKSGFKNKLKDKPEFFMDGKEVFNFAISNVPSIIKSLIANKSKKINFYVLHQANRMMLDKIFDLVKIENSKRLFSIKNYGNTSSASIPITISHKLKKNYSAKSCLLVGFGAGFSFAGCLVDLKKTKIFGVLKI